MSRLPWYAFLYRLFGAQGTFWLWIAAVVAVWWTATPALQRLANRKPVLDRSVAAAGRESAGDLTRWVVVEGVEVRLDRRLLLDARPPALPPYPLLMDPQDAAARWWTRSRALADVTAGEVGALPAAGGVAGALCPTLTYPHLTRRLAALEGGGEPVLPAPERCLLVQDRELPALSPSPPARRGDLSSEYVRVLLARAALLHERVRPAQKVSGVLVEVPPVIKDRIRAELDTVVAPLLLQRDREPRDLESFVFAGAAITLLLLVAGFHGATLVKRAAA